MITSEIIESNRESFSKEFLEWFPENKHIWRAFVIEAHKVIDAGFKHYSARTIIHVLRHHSAISEAGGEWKINNNISPYLARLFALCYPAHADLFSFRSTPRANLDHVF